MWDVSFTIIFHIHTELLLHVQFCYEVMSVDNKIWSGVHLHKIQFNVHVPKILEIGLNNVKIWKRKWRLSIHVVSQFVKSSIYEK